MKLTQSISMTTKASSTPGWLLPSIVSTGIAYIVYNIANKQDNESKQEEKKEEEDLILPHTTDNYNGVRMNDASKLPTNKQEFEQRLVYSLNEWRQNGKRGCWIKLTKPFFEYLTFCVSLGFNVHHAQPEYIMLETWLPKTEKSMIPSYAYSYMGGHAFIINDKSQIVVIREHYRSKIWKVPGGAIDFEEHATDGAQREAKVRLYCLYCFAVNLMGLCMSFDVNVFK